MRSVPPLGGDTQATIRIVELLPAPFGPRKPNASPLRTATSIPATATDSPNAFVRRRAEIITAAVSPSIRRTLPRGSDNADPMWLPAAPRELPTARPVPVVAGQDSEGGFCRTRVAGWSACHGPPASSPPPAATPAPTRAPF